MKYEEWIKYEEIRQNQPDKFAWIASPDMNTNPSQENRGVISLSYPTNHPKKNLWMLIYQRFISRRI